MIVRIVLWRLDERGPSVDAVRQRIDELEPLDPPGAFLLNEAAERIGAFVVDDEDGPAPGQLEDIRALIGRDPDLYEEFDTV